MVNLLKLTEMPPNRAEELLLHDIQLSLAIVITADANATATTSADSGCMHYSTTAQDFR
jgi:hypothetical protein